MFRPWFVNSDFTSDLHITTVLYLQRMICQTLSWLIFPISFVVVKNVTTEGDCYIQHISTITLSIDIVLYQISHFFFLSVLTQLWWMHKFLWRLSTWNSKWHQIQLKIILTIPLQQFGKSPRFNCAVFILTILTVLMIGKNNLFCQTE